MATSLYKHQLEALRKLKNGSVLCGGVGSGKSRTALAYYYTRIGGGSLRVNGVGKDIPMRNKVPLYIVTTARKRDTSEWQLECAPFGISVEPPDGAVVDSWNNIDKYATVEDAFFIFDEQRVVGSGKWSKTFIRIARNNRWILLSATPGDTWMDYASIFIAKGYFRNKTEFLKKHVVFKRFVTYPKVDRYLHEDILERYRSETVVNMHMQRSVRRKHVDVQTKYDSESMRRISKDRWDIFADKPIRDASGYCATMRRLVNSDPSRIEKTLALLRKHGSAIIFYNFNYELEALRTALESERILYSEWNGHKHEPIPSGTNWAYLVQYTAGAEGWNCIQTDTIIFYSLNYSYKIMVQAAGRTDRLNTPFNTLYYYHLTSDAKIDKDISSALKRKENFNEKMFCSDQSFPENGGGAS